MAYIEQPFPFGKNPDLRGQYFSVYPLEALFYDAYRGVRQSRRLILIYISNCINNRQPVPVAVQDYLSNILLAVADGDVPPDFLLNSKGIHSKGSALSPAIVDMVEACRRGKNGEKIPKEDNAKGAGAYTLAGERLAGMYKAVSPRLMEDYVNMGVRPAGDYKPFHENTIANLCSRQENREERILHVQEILDRFYSDSHKGDGPECRNLCRQSMTELKEIYKNINTLD